MSHLSLVGEFIRNKTMEKVGWGCPPFKVEGNLNFSNECCLISLFLKISVI